MKDENKLLSVLGLAQKAGKLASGEVAVQMAARAGKAKLLLLAADTAENSRSGILSLAASYSIPVYECSSRRLLGGAIGKAERAAIAVLDNGFAVMIKKLF